MGPQGSASARRGGVADDEEQENSDLAIVAKKEAGTHGQAISMGRRGNYPSGLPKCFAQSIGELDGVAV